MVIFVYSVEVMYEFSRMPNFSEEYRKELEIGMQIDRQLNRRMDEGFEIFHLSKNQNDSWTVILRKPKL